MHDFRSAIAATKGADPSDIDAAIASFERDERSKRRPLRSAVRKMDEAAFWSLIAQAQAEATSDTQLLDIIEITLATFDSIKIEHFQDIVIRLLNKAYTWELWAVAYAARLGCGDDEFAYFRSWLILEGRETFEAAIADPIAWGLDFSFDRDPQSEGLQSVALTAYRNRTGGDMPPRRIKHRPRPSGRTWLEEDFKVRFPALTDRFELRS